MDREFQSLLSWIRVLNLGGEDFYYGWGAGFQSLLSWIRVLNQKRKSN